jgi:hypothetical protein
MAGKSKTNAVGDGMMFAAPEILNGVNTAFSQAADRGLVAMGAAYEQWATESRRLYDEMSAQGSEALEQLKTCKSPMDVLSVEQAWFAARSKTFMESGMRFAQAFTTLAQGLAPTDTPPPPAASAV